MNQIKAKKHFSMLEVLVVIVVISILAALIFSGSREMRELGQRTQCLNNLRQIQLVVESFKKDHREAPFNVESVSYSTFGDFSFAEDYVKEENLHHFICPGDADASEIASYADLDGNTSYIYIPTEEDIASAEIMSYKLEVPGEYMVIYDEDTSHHQGNLNIVYLHGEGNSKGGIATTITYGGGEWVELASVPTVPDTPKVPDNPPVDPKLIDPDDTSGLIGGHFDVDTSSSAASGSGSASTDGHIHEYDNKHDVRGIDAFNFHDSKLHGISQDIPDGKRFIFHTVNEDINKGVVVSTNAPLGTILSMDGVYGTTQLTSLKLDLPAEVIIQGGLAPTETKLVRSNTPGANGEYRSGAFALQALEVDADGNPLYVLGADGAATSGLLWEVTLFWHVKPIDDKKKGKK